MIPKPCPNTKSVQTLQEKCILNLQAQFGKEGNEGKQMNMPVIISKLETLQAVLDKMTNVQSQEVVSPHVLDAQSAYVSACNEIKTCLTEILHYADDYSKRNFMMKKAMASKLKGKFGMHINSLASITRMLESLAHNHNQAMLQQQALDDNTSQKASEIQQRIFQSQKENKAQDINFQLGNLMADKFKQVSKPAAGMQAKQQKSRHSNVN